MVLPDFPSCSPGEDCEGSIGETHSGHEAQGGEFAKPTDSIRTYGSVVYGWRIRIFHWWETQIGVNSLWF